MPDRPPHAALDLSEYQNELDQVLGVSPQPPPQQVPLEPYQQDLDRALLGGGAGQLDQFAQQVVADQQRRGSVLDEIAGHIEADEQRKRQGSMLDSLAREIVEDDPQQRALLQTEPHRTGIGEHGYGLPSAPDLTPAQKANLDLVEPGSDQWDNLRSDIKRQLHYERGTLGIDAPDPSNTGKDYEHGWPITEFPEYAPAFEEEADPQERLGAWINVEKRQRQFDKEQNQEWADYTLERTPFVGGLFTADQLTKLYHSSNKFQAGKADMTDYRRLAEFAVDLQEQAQQDEEYHKLQEQTDSPVESLKLWTSKRFAPKALDLLSQLPAFVVEFAATGGGYTATRKAVKEGLEKALKETAEKGVKGALKRGAIGVGSRAAGVAAQTAMNPQLIARSTAQDALEKSLAGESESLWKSLPSGIADAFIELASERAGARLGQAAGKIPGVRRAGVGLKKLRQKVTRDWLKLNPSKGVGDLRKMVAERGGWHGVIGEIGEERVGELARSSLNEVAGTSLETGIAGSLAEGDVSGAGTQLAAEAAAFSVPGAAGGSAQLVGSVIDKYRKKHGGQRKQAAEELRGKLDQITGAVREPAEEFIERPTRKNFQKLKQSTRSPESTPTPPATTEGVQTPVDEAVQQEPTETEAPGITPEGPQPEPSSAIAEESHGQVSEPGPATPSARTSVQQEGEGRYRIVAEIPDPDPERTSERRRRGAPIPELADRMEVVVEAENEQEAQERANRMAQRMLEKFEASASQETAGPESAQEPRPEPPSGIPEEPQGPVGEPATPKPAGNLDEIVQSSNVRVPHQVRGTMRDVYERAESPSYEKWAGFNPRLAEQLGDRGPQAWEVFVGEQSAGIPEEGQGPTGEDAEPEQRQLTPEEESLSEEIPKLVPGSQVETTPTGLRATTPGGGQLDVEVVEDVAETSGRENWNQFKRSLEKRKGRQLTDEEARAARINGSFKFRLNDGTEYRPSGLIRLRRGGARSQKLRHELLHFAKRAGLFEDQEWSALVQQHSDPSASAMQQEEDIAKATEAWGKGGLREKVVGALDRILNSLGLKNLSGDAVRTVMESEEFWSRPDKFARQGGESAQPEQRGAFQPGDRVRYFTGAENRVQRTGVVDRVDDDGVIVKIETIKGARARPGKKSKVQPAELEKMEPEGAPPQQSPLQRIQDLDERIGRYGKERTPDTKVEFQEIESTVDEIGKSVNKADAIKLARDFGAQGSMPTKRAALGHIKRRLNERLESIERTNFGTPAEQTTSDTTRGTTSAPDATLARKVAEHVDSGRPLPVKQFWSMADESYGGTRAEGKYGPSDAYDALETGVNLSIANSGITPAQETGQAKNAVGQLQDLTQSLPSQTNRSGEKEQFQQFSTPPAYSYTAAWLGNIGQNDVVLEPSAGTGDLAVFARNAGADVYANEISDRRANLLRELGFQDVFTEDAEQIPNILPDRMPQPNVVLMNPPFSKSGHRTGDKKKAGTDLRHVDAALNFLAPEGRLVAIIGGGLHGETATFKKWLQEAQQKYNVRAAVNVGRDVYKGYGTTFPTRVLVIDKTGPTPEGGTRRGKADTLPDLIDQLEDIRNERTPAQQKRVQPAGEGEAVRGERDVGEQPAVRTPTSPVARRGQSPTPSEAPSPSAPAARGQGGRASGARGSEGVAGEGSVQRGRDDGGTGEAGGGDVSGKRRADDGGGDAGETGRPPAGTRSRVRVAKEERESDSLFRVYTPNIDFKEAQPHKASTVETVAMASIPLPESDYQPQIPQEVIESGDLSDIQLEAIAYAGKAHSKKLPAVEGETRQRQGFMLGDGTGMGKTRELLGVILDNMQRGRKKAILLSPSTKLFEQAQNDWEALGQNRDDLFFPPKASESIGQDSGILFMTYDTLIQGKPGANRFEQVKEWIGDDFDGVIAFDEAHKNGNALVSDQEVQQGSSGRRGGPSGRAVKSIALQRFAPDARVLYLTATSAAEVRNMAFAERLGLWGRGTPFPTVHDFVNEIDAQGVGAMEVVARDLKARGLYLARSIAYDDGTKEGTVVTERQHVPLSEEQRTAYNRIAEAWQVVLGNINDAIKETGQPRRVAESNLWSTQQRFFNSIITAMQTPSVIQSAEKDLQQGKAPVIQLVSTGGSALDRELARVGNDSTKYGEVNLTPLEDLMGYVEKSFPIQQYEEVTDEDGRTSQEPVTDSQGNPVVNQAAKQIRDRLLQDLESLKDFIPGNPLDQIVEHFGADDVAEVSGRTQRLVWDRDEDGRRTRKLQKMTGKFHQRDAQAFRDGKKRVLVISKAGQTGLNFHAERGSGNESQRVHYLLEAGWSAIEALQGMGRTHRNNQTAAPIYRLVSTDIPAQKRFISTIARRLAQLGALTRGQSRSESGDLFGGSDNLETKESQRAVMSLIDDIAQGRLDIGVEEFEKQTGLRIQSAKGGQLQNYPAVKQFLNRMLSLDLPMQEKVFQAFMERLQMQVEVSRRMGALDEGVKSLKADKVEKLADKIVRTDEDTGAETRYVKLRTHEPIKPHTLKDLKAVEKESRSLDYRRNTRGNLRAVADFGSTTTDKKGRVLKTYKVFFPEGSVSYMNSDELRKWQTVENGEAEWQEVVQNLPSHNQREAHLITGIMLPVWDRFQGDVDIRRTVTDEGEVVLGRKLGRNNLQQTLKRLGVSEQAGESLDTDNLLDRVAGGGVEAELSNGWRLVGSRVQGEKRVEITGPSFVHERQLEAAGVKREVIGGKPRYFIPVNDEAVLRKVTTDSNVDIIDIVPAGEEEGDRLAAQVGGPSTFPGNASGRAPFADEPPSTSKGRELLERLIDDDQRQRGPAKVGLRSIVEFTVGLANAQLLVGKTQTTKKKPALFETKPNTIRSRVGASQVNFHEAGHALSNYLKDADSRWYADQDAALTALTGLEGSMASAENAEEGVAEFVRRYVVDYKSIPKTLRADMEEKLSSIAPEMLAGLKDAHKAYQFYLQRPFEDQMGSLKNDRPPAVVKTGALWDTVYRALYQIVGGEVAVHATRRRILKPLYKFSQEIAEGFEQQIKDTPADIQSIYQSTIRIPWEQYHAINGTKEKPGLRVLATGQGFNEILNDQQIETLRDGGFEVSEGVSHGEFVYLTDQSFQDIRDQVGAEEWHLFESYGQYKAALERHLQDGHDYPGMRDGLTPARLQQWISEVEQEFPEWPNIADQVRKFFDGTLMVGVLSGEFTPTEAVTIKNKWQDYWPLLRQSEGDASAGLPTSSAEPSIGIRSAFGSEAPFRSLWEAAEVRTRAALDAYYENRKRLAFRQFAKELNQDQRINRDIRQEAARLMLPLRMEQKKVVTLSRLEEAELVADAVNRTRAAELGVEEGQLPEDEKIEPDQVVVSRAGQPIFRARKPDAVNVVSITEAGQRKYYQVNDPLLFSLFSAGQHGNKYFNWLTKFLLKPLRPWKRALTKNILFAARNIPRDASTGMFMGEDAESFGPFFYATTGIMNRLKGRTENLPDTGDLWTRSIEATSTQRHRGIVGSFQDMLAEGIKVPGYGEMTPADRLAEAPGQLMSAAMKPIDIINWLTGGWWASQASEEAPRHGAYLTALRKGYSEETARAEFDQITGNFGQRQPSQNVAAVVRSAGFLNPALQIMWGQFRRLGDPNPKLQKMYAAKLPALAFWGGVAAAGEYLLIQALYPDDDDRKKILKNLKERSDEERLSTFHVAGKARFPFDYGITGSAMSYGWNSVEEWLLEDPIEAPKKAAELLRRARDLPVPSDVVHPYIKTGYELSMGEGGYSFFYDDDIVPDYLVSQYPFNPELRAHDDTPEFYKRAGRSLNVSPIKVQYGTKQLFTRQADEAIRAVEKLATGKKFDGIPFLRRVMVPEYTGFRSASVQELKELDKRWDSINTRLRDLKGQLGSQETQELQEQRAKLHTAKFMMDSVEDTWQQVKEERTSEKPDREQIKSLERSMTRKARAFADWRQSGKGEPPKTVAKAFAEGVGATAYQATEATSSESRRGKSDDRDDTIETRRTILRELGVSYKDAIQSLRTYWHNRFGNYPTGRNWRFRARRLRDTLRDD